MQIPLPSTQRGKLGRAECHALVEQWVLVFKGEPIKQVSTMAWYKALKRATIEDFHWHDVRHTWAPSHVQGGTPLFALQELAGWETEKMARRYAHLAAEHLEKYVQHTECHGTNTAQPPDVLGTGRSQPTGM